MSDEAPAGARAMANPLLRVGFSSGIASPSFSQYGLSNSCGASRYRRSISGHARDIRCLIAVGVRYPGGNCHSGRVPSRRVGGGPHHRGRSARTSAHRCVPIQRDIAAQRQGSRADLRRRSGAAPHQHRARDARIRVHQGDILHGRSDGERLSRHGAPRSRRRTHDREPQPNSSLHLQQDVGGAGRGADPGRICLAACRARRSRCRRAFLSHSRAAAAGTRSSNTWPRTAS